MAYEYQVELNDKPKDQQKTVVPINDPSLQKELVVASIAYQNSLTRLNETDLYLRGLHEIRTALNYPSVKDGDAGLAERPPLKAMFDDEIDIGRLKDRYFALLDRYLAYTKKFSSKQGITDEKFDVDGK